MTSKLFRTFLFLNFLYLVGCSGGANTDELTMEEPLKQIEEELFEANGPETLSETPVELEEPAVDTTVVQSNEQYEDIDWQEYEESMTQDYSFVIIISTKDYDAALERAEEASEKLGYKLDLRGLKPNVEMGLTLPKDVCEGICGGDVVEFPQYLPRDSWGDTKYVSVEYSNGFDGFNPGYYIVIVASGEKGDPVIQESLDHAKKFYDDAYAKTCGVWMGCGC